MVEHLLQGVGQYTQVDSKRIAAGSASAGVQKGMMSDNTRQYEYLTNSIISDMNKRFGDFDLGLMVGGMPTDSISLNQTI